MLQELQIQSNLPLIILTILVICIVVIGYLEIKKIHNSIDTINNRIDTLKKTELSNININDLPIQEKIIPPNNLQPDNIELNQEMNIQLDQEIDNTIPPQEKEEEVKQNNNEIPPEIMNAMPPGFPVESMMAGLPFGNIVLGGPILPMGFEAKDMHESGMTFEEDIDDNNDEIVQQELNEENIQEIEEMNNLIEENENSESENSNISELSDSDEEEEEEEEDSDEEDSDEEDKQSQNQPETVNKTINFNPVVQIDETLSVKQLKTICEDMNLPQSGNKSQLIQRIKQHQK